MQKNKHINKAFLILGILVFFIIVGMTMYSKILPTKAEPQSRNIFSLSPNIVNSSTDEYEHSEEILQNSIVTLNATIANHEQVQTISLIKEISPSLIQMHIHFYTVETTTKPSCTRDGKMVAKCSCGEEYIETSDMLGHNYKQSSSVAPTYTIKGSKTYKCTRCGDKYTDEVPMLLCQGDFDLCGDSLLEQPLKHGELGKYVSDFFDKYHEHNASGSEEGDYYLPSNVSYSEFREVMYNSYGYIWGHVPVSKKTFEDGTTRLNIGCNEDVEHDIEIAYNRAFEILRELKIDKNTTQKEAIIRINDYLCGFKYYQDIGPDSSIYRSVMESAGVCRHYAYAFQVICLAAGIECHYYVSYDMNHAFNKIYFSDGSYLWCDVTWNDNSNPEKWYRYLLITEKQLLKDHSLT